jgi:tetratricopeptide (TPR) repeat protein
MIDSALAALNDAPSSDERAERRLGLLIDRAASLRVVDRFEPALESLSQALDLAHDRPQDLARVHFHRGNVFFSTGQIEACVQAHEDARASAQEAGSKELEALALGGLGDAHYLRGRMKSAHDVFVECVRLAEEIDSPWLAAANRPMIGHTGLYLGRVRESLELGRRAVDLAREAGHHRAEMVCRGLVFFCHVELQQPAAAEQSLRDCLAICRRVGSRNYETVVQLRHARLLMAAGDIARCREANDEAMVLLRGSAPGFTGPGVLGLQAALLDSADRSAADALRAEAEDILAAGAVSHTFVDYHEICIDAALERGSYDDVARSADALEAFTRDEPVLRVDLLVRRARALLACQGAPPDAAQRGALTAVLEELKDGGYTRLGLGIEAALAR